MWKAKIVALIITILNLGVLLLWYSSAGSFSKDIELRDALKYFIFTVFLNLGLIETMALVWRWALRKEKATLQSVGR